ncbi:MAG: PEGA domain-containing protein [Byssovorax sp.]
MNFFLKPFFAVVLIAIALVGSAHPALAGAGPSSGSPPQGAAPSRDRADELFDQGTAAFDAGRWSEARSKFEQAWALKQTHDIAGNLGIAEVQLGKFLNAAEHLAWALDHLPPTESSATRKGLEQALEKARSQVGVLRLRVNVDGAAVVINGGAVGVVAKGKTLFVEPGAVTVSVQKEGYLEARQTITVPRGEAREMSLTLAPTPGSGEKRSLVPGVIMGGVAIAALAAGAGLLVDAGAKGATAKELSDSIAGAGHGCAEGTPAYDSRCPELFSTASAGDSRHSAGIGLAVGGGAAAVAATVYFLWPTSRANVTGPKAMRVAPAVSTTTGGLLFSGTF